MNTSDGGRPRLAAIGAFAALQAVLLAWALARPDTVPPGADLSILLLTVVVAAVFALDARRTAAREGGDSWWRPDWRQWAVAGLFPGANAGVFLGYLLRRREAARADEPSGYWKRPLVLGVVATTLGSLASRQYFDPAALSPPGAVVLVGVLVLVGFTFVAAYYDLQYVSLARSAAGDEWLADGIYWLAVLGFPIPGRVFFLAIYVFRRRLMLGRVADGADIETLPTGVGPSDAAGDDEDTAEETGREQPTLPTETGGE